MSEVLELRSTGERDVELAKIAQRLIMMELDHSRANKIDLISDEDKATTKLELELPPHMLRFFADLLGMMSRHELITLVPHDHEMSTQEVANFLNVSRPFVVKLIDEGHLKCKKVGRHRRVEMADAIELRSTMQQDTEQARRDIARTSVEFGLETI
jgi:excisionase family DNA binding protein